MDKYIYDENNRLWYELQGDYYIPCLYLPIEKQKPNDILLCVQKMGNIHAKAREFGNTKLIFTQYFKVAKKSLAAVFEEMSIFVLLTNRTNLATLTTVKKFTVH